MDKKNTAKEKPKQPSPSYVPRRDYGDMTEDEALEAHREGKNRVAWDEETINRMYNPNRRRF